MYFATAHTRDEVAWDTQMHTSPGQESSDLSTKVTLVLNITIEFSNILSVLRFKLTSFSAYKVATLFQSNFEVGDVLFTRRELLRSS